VSTYAVGDVQGCYPELRRLLRAAGYRDGADEVWFVGDLINRGPRNLETVRWVMRRERRGRAQCVLGNHDLHFLAVAAGCRHPHRSDTFADLLAAPDLDEIVHWLRHLPLLHYRHPWVLVHAGLPPQWSIDKSLKRAAEVEAALRSDDYRDFLRHMYGNSPAAWKKSLTGQDRLRVITNYFTRMRYARSNGDLELTHTGNTAPEGFRPWFRLPRRRHAGLRILFGHWASLGGVTGTDGVHALDTGCVWGRDLTLMRLEDGRTFAVPCGSSRRP
jgi:bis(5'-nucleosyl)-tetraphosphatase (symmetrical)